MVRAPFYDKNGLKKGAWSKEEDDRLRACIQKYGHPNWRQLPKFAGLARCGKSCRLRWMNYLRPNLKHGNYTLEEEEIIIKLNQQFGNKWSLIAEKLAGRTDNEIKNHWHSHLKKHIKRSKPTSEFKPKPSETCEGKSTTVIGTDFPNILESSLSKCTETSHTEDKYSSSFTSGSNGAPLTMNWFGVDSVASWETLEEFSSDFWTEPFLVENTYTDEILTSYQDSALCVSYSHEVTDLLYQSIMK